MNFLLLFVGLFLLTGLDKVNGATLRKRKRIHYSEDVEANADTLIYQPKTYKYYQNTQQHYPIQQQPVYYYPQYQPVYYQQPTYYYPTYSYPSYGSGGGFGFNFCLACFGFGFGKK
uniref:Uncharacterized protein n=1 Tax=Panagrolaimus sp. JU765 TaxID=591449 RepID=A0AC34QF55_9BILA